MGVSTEPNRSQLHALRASEPGFNPLEALVRCLRPPDEPIDTPDEWAWTTARELLGFDPPPDYRYF